MNSEVCEFSEAVCMLNRGVLTQLVIVAPVRHVRVTVSVSGVGFSRNEKIWRVSEDKVCDCVEDRMKSR